MTLPAQTHQIGEELFRSVEESVRYRDYFSALALCEQALSDSPGSDAALRGRILARIGDLYVDLGDYPNGLDYYQQALDTFIDAEDLEMTAVTQHLIGVLLGETGEFDMALEYLDRALTLFRESGSRLMEVGTMRNMGAILLARGDADEALEYELRVLTVYDALGDRVNAAAAMIAIAEIHEKCSQPAAALSYYLRASEVLEETEETRLLSAALLGLGRIYREVDDPDSARFALEQGNVLAEEAGDRMLVCQFQIELSRILERLGDYRGALEHARRYATMREEFVNEERNRSIAELQLRFGLERELKEEELKRQHDVTQAVLEAQEIERRRIAGELHDGIGQMLAAIRLNMLRLRSMSFDADEDSAYRRSLDLIEKTTTDVRSISHSLGSSTLHELGIIAALREIVADMNNSEQIRFAFEESAEADRIPVQIGLGLFRVAQELVSNVVRHSQATEATVQLFLHHNAMSLMVVDNGVGFDIDNCPRGMGTRNIEARVHTMNGTVRFDSARGHGTTVTVDVPLPPREGPHGGT